MKKLASIGALILLFIFLGSAIVLVILGMTTYKDIAKSSREQADVRTSIKYLADHMRKFDCKDGVSIRNIQGTDVLVYTEKIGQDTYEMWLYGYKGNLYEMSKHEAGDFNLREGKVIAQVDVLSIDRVAPNLVKIKLQDEGGLEYTYVLAVRSDEKAVQYED